MKRTVLAALILLVTAIGAACLLGGCSSSSSSGPDVSVDADLVLTPATGTVLRDVVCDASGSASRSRALEYRWDFDGDGTWDTAWSSTPTAERRFSGADTITVVVKVRDGEATDEAEAQFVVDNRHGHEVSATLVGGNGPQCLAWDGSHIWRSDWSADEFYRTDPFTGAVVETLAAVNQWPNGIEWDGTSLWVTDSLGGMRMFEIDPTTGDTLFSFPAGSSNFAGGIAWDGTYLYQGRRPGAGYPGSINKYMPDGTLVETLPPPRGTRTPFGLAFDGENLWFADANVDTLYALDPTDGSVRWAVHAEYLMWGVTVDDEGMLWVHRTGVGYHIARIVP